jgi:uncharacterized membrane protein YgcG
MSRRPLALSTTVVAACAVMVASCGALDGTTGASTPIVPPSTLPGVGVLPAVAPADRPPLVIVAPPVNADGSAAEPLGVVAQGNRVLLIGDSILASTSSRYGGQMCEALVPLGWQVSVEAEPSRFIDFGNRVLDKALAAETPPELDWDVAVVFLGSNYGGDETAYEDELRRILDRLAPRPTLLLTVTEYRPYYDEVNEVIGRFGSFYENVTVLDWRTVSQTPGVLSGDRLHPTDAGRNVLAQAIAAALGPIGIGQGGCLKPVFRDDSGIDRKSSGSNVADGAPVRPPASATTTVPRSQPTTTVSGSDGSSGGSTGGGSGSGGSGSGGSTGGGSGSGGSSGVTTTVTTPSEPTPTPAPPPPPPAQPAPPPPEPITTSG